eukprot:COSAG05_NODE_5826_length_1078_cov_10.599591_3_plen_28_part_01
MCNGGAQAGGFGMSVGLDLSVMELTDPA